MKVTEWRSAAMDVSEKLATVLLTGMTNAEIYLIIFILPLYKNHGVKSECSNDKSFVYIWSREWASAD